MFKKIAGCVLVSLILWMIYIVFHSPGSVTKFAPQRISEVCGVSVTKLIYLREEGESALYRAKTMDVDFSQMTHYRKKGDLEEKRNFGFKMQLHLFELMKDNAGIADYDYSSCDDVYCYRSKMSPYFTIMIAVLGDDCEIMFIDRL